MDDIPTQLRTAGVDLGGLMTVLGRHLYSTPNVALRELVQNAHDSIVRRRIEEPSWTGPSRIAVIGDPAEGVIRVIDTGAGLTEDEIHDYLATVGVGYTRRLRDGPDRQDELIGMFGLGFLSAFVLARRVTLTTTSFQQPDRGWRYQSTNAEQYQLAAVPARDIGTEVTLELRDEFRHLSGEMLLESVLGRYCALLREPITIGAAAEPINREPPPWRTGTASGAIEHPVQRQRRELAFAARFEHRFEPICTLPVEPDDDSDARGLLWVQDGSSYGTSDNRNMAVFVRGMLLDDDARDLLPPWAGFIGGVIESNRLTPTASREDLQRDAGYRATQQALAQALIRGLQQLARTRPEAWRRTILRHNEALLGAALCSDALFDLLADEVSIPTSQGDMKPAAVRSGSRMHVSLGGSGGFEDMLFRALRVPVAHGDRYAVVPFLRRWAARHGVTLVELGTEGGDKKLFQAAELPGGEADWLRAALGDGELIVPAHFAPAELPLVVVPNREAELKRRLEEDAADRRISISALRLVRGYTAGIDGSVTARMYVNLDNPAIRSLLAAHRAGRPEAAIAAALLKAVKTVMSAGAESSRSGSDLNAALREIGRVATRLLGTDADTTEDISGEA